MEPHSYVMAAGGSSEQINGPNYLVNLLKNLAAIASTQTYQDMLKNASSAAISSNAGNYVVNGFTIQEQAGQPIPGTESSAGKYPFITCSCCRRKIITTFEIKWSMRDLTCVPRRASSKKIHEEF
jgi:hypothetical protein